MVQTPPIVKTEDIYLRIKEKRERHAKKVNQNLRITTFNIGDLVLVRSYPVSDAFNKVISKFCDLYEGPYRISKQVSNATYTLEYI